MTSPTSGKANHLRRFVLLRHKDESGNSGTGIVAEGVQFSSGRCVLTWLTSHTSIAVYDTVGVVMAIHAHGGYTQIVWIDDDGPCYQRP